MNNETKSRRKPLLFHKRLTVPTRTNAPVLCLIRTGGATGSALVGTVHTSLSATLADVRELLVSLARAVRNGESGPLEAQQRRLTESPPVNLTAEDLHVILGARLHPFDLCAPFTFVQHGGCLPVPRRLERKLRVSEALPEIPAFGLPQDAPGWTFSPPPPLVTVVRRSGKSAVEGDHSAVTLREAMVVLFVSQGNAEEGGLHSEKVVMERLLMQQEAYGRAFQAKHLASLTNKWNANVRDVFGRTVLMEAVLAGSEAAVRFLVALPYLHVNAADTRGNTALHYAVAKGNVAIVSIIAEAGGDMLCPNVKGETPLHVALSTRNDACVDVACRRLQAKGIGAETLAAYRDDVGQSPLDLFRLYSPSFRQVVDEGDLDAVRALLRHYLFDQSTVTERDAILHQTAVHAAAEQGHVDVLAHLLGEVRLPHLLQASSHWGWADARGQTPLHLAAQRGHLEVVKLLMAQFPEHLTHTDISGRTPLLAALSSRQLEVAEFITATAPSGAVGQDVLDANGFGALHFACSLHHGKLAQLLAQRHGAPVEARRRTGVSQRQRTSSALPSPIEQPMEFLRVSRSVKGRYASLRQRRKPTAVRYMSRETVHEGPTPLACAVHVCVLRNRRWLEQGEVTVHPAPFQTKLGLRRSQPSLVPPTMSSESVIEFLVQLGAGKSCTPTELEQMVSSLLLVNGFRVAELLLPLLLESNHKKSNALLCAMCEAQNSLAVRWCVERKLCSLALAEGGCPLVVSARMGDVQSVRFLLTHGASPNVRAAAGGVGCGLETPLLAAIRGHHANVVEELVAAGAQVSFPEDMDAPAPLTVAAIAACEPVVRGFLGLAMITTRYIVPAFVAVFRDVWRLTPQHRFICAALAKKISVDESPVHPTELMHLAASRGDFASVELIAESLTNLPRTALAEVMAASPPAPQRHFEQITPAPVPLTVKAKRLVGNRATGRAGLFRSPVAFRRLVLPRRCGPNRELPHRHQLRDVFSYAAEGKQGHLVQFLLHDLHMTPWRGADLRGWNACDYALHARQYDIVRGLAACGMVPFEPHSTRSGAPLTVLARTLHASRRAMPVTTAWPGVSTALSVVLAALADQGPLGSTASGATATPGKRRADLVFGDVQDDSVLVLRALMRTVCALHDVTAVTVGGEWMTPALLACVRARRLDLLRVLVVEFKVDITQPLKGSHQQLLPLAAANRDGEMVTFLLCHGAPPHAAGELDAHTEATLCDARRDAPHRLRRTALSIAALLNDTNMVEALAFSAPLDAETCTNTSTLRCDALAALVAGANPTAPETHIECLAKCVGLLARAGHLYTSPKILRQAARKRLHLVVSAIVENYGSQTILADLKAGELGCLHYIVADPRSTDLLREVLMDDPAGDEEDCVEGEGFRANDGPKGCPPGNPLVAKLHTLHFHADCSPLRIALRHGCAENAVVLLAADVPTALWTVREEGNPREASAFVCSGCVGRCSRERRLLCTRLSTVARRMWQRHGCVNSGSLLDESDAPYSALHAAAALNYPDVFERLAREMSQLNPRQLHCTIGAAQLSVVAVALRHADGRIASRALRLGCQLNAVGDRAVFEILSCRTVAQRLKTRIATDSAVDTAHLICHVGCVAATADGERLDLFALAAENFNVREAMRLMRRHFYHLNGRFVIASLTALGSAIVFSALDVVQAIVFDGSPLTDSRCAKLTEVAVRVIPRAPVVLQDRTSPSSCDRSNDDSDTSFEHGKARRSNRRIVAPPRHNCQLCVFPVLRGESYLFVSPLVLSAALLAAAWERRCLSGRGGAALSGDPTEPADRLDAAAEFPIQKQIFAFLLRSGALTLELINPLAIVVARLRQWDLLHAVVDAAEKLHRDEQSLESGSSKRFFATLRTAEVPPLLNRCIGTARHVIHVAARCAPREAHVLVARHSLRRDVESAVDADGKTAMYHALRNPRPESFDTMVALRIPCGALCCCRAQRTPLMVAAEYGNAHAAAALLKKGVDVNAVDAAGNTALILASLAGHVPIIELLLSADALTSTVNRTGLTAVLAAARYGHDSIALSLAQHFCVGADFRTPSTSLLHCAAVGGCARVTESVLHMWERGSVLDSDASGHSPLYLAYAFGHAHVLRLLLGAMARMGQKPASSVDCHIVSCSSKIPRYGWLRAVLRVGDALQLESSKRHSHRLAIRPGEQLYLPRTKPLRSMRSRLLWCARYNHAVGIRVLADLNVADDCFALHEAASKGHLDVIQLLVLLEMSRVDERDAGGYYALERAIRSGFSESAAFLLQNMRVTPLTLSSPPIAANAAPTHNILHVIASSRCTNLLPELMRRLFTTAAAESEGATPSRSVAEDVLAAFEVVDESGMTPFECAVASGSPVAVLRVAQALQVSGREARRSVSISLSNTLLRNLLSISPPVRVLLYDLFSVAEMSEVGGGGSSLQNFGDRNWSTRLQFPEVRLLGFNALRAIPSCVDQMQSVCTVDHEWGVLRTLVEPTLPFKIGVDLASLSRCSPGDQVRCVRWLGTSLLLADLADAETGALAKITEVQVHIEPSRQDVFVSIAPDGVMKVGVHIGKSVLGVPDVATRLRTLSGASEASLLRRVERASKCAARRLRALPHGAFRSAKIVVDWDGYFVGASAPVDRDDATAMPPDALKCLLEKGLPSLTHLADFAMADIVADLSARELNAVSGSRQGGRPTDVRFVFRYAPPPALLIAKRTDVPLGEFGDVVVGFSEHGVEDVPAKMAPLLRALRRDANLVHIHHIRDRFVKHVVATCSSKMGGEALKFKLELEGGGVDEVPMHLLEETLRNVAEALSAMLVDAKCPRAAFRMSDLRSSAIVANSVARDIRTVQVLFSTRRAPLAKRADSKLLLCFTPSLTPTRSDVYDALREHTVDLEIERIKNTLPNLVTDMGQRLNTYLPSTSLVVDTASIVEDADDENVLAALALLSHGQGSLVFQALIEGVAVGWDTELGGIIRKSTHQITISLERGSIGTLAVLPGGHAVYYCPLLCVQRGMHHYSSWCLLSSQQIASLLITQLAVEFPEIRSLVHRDKAFACWTTAYGRNTRFLPAGAPRCRFTLQTRNILNRPVRHGGEVFQFSGRISSFTTKDRGNGSYSVLFGAPTRAGRYVVDIRMHGMPIFNSPLVLRVRPLDVDLRSTLLKMDFNTVVAGVPFAVELHLRDRFGNAICDKVDGLVVEGPTVDSGAAARVKGWRFIRTDVVEVTLEVVDELATCVMPLRIATATDSDTVAVRVECVSQGLYSKIRTLLKGFSIDSLAVRVPADRVKLFFRRAYRRAENSRWRRDALSIGGVFNRKFPATVASWWAKRVKRRSDARQRLRRRGAKKK